MLDTWLSAQMIEFGASYDLLDVFQRVHCVHLFLSSTTTSMSNVSKTHREIVKLTIT